MGSGGVAIAALFIVICLEVSFSDGLGEGWRKVFFVCLVSLPKQGGLEGL